MNYGSLEEMERVFTDSRCPQSVRDYCAQRDIRLTVAGQTASGISAQG